ncbi:hypothetical protein QCE47_23385 [Caballeronia sp. LZ025]|uniref:hypothetical protein n=1 Tax=Caballeronia TaxID=1827195 RepID=UPI001FD61D97|nr:MULTISPECIES: hypothetical protein [Caballeronia]MDR5735266.1 hypothetical protein [Caballeronia sp. LZ025]
MSLQEGSKRQPAEIACVFRDMQIMSVCFSLRRYSMTKKLLVAAAIACLSAGVIAKPHEFKHYEKFEHKEHRENIEHAREHRDEREHREVRDEHKRAEEIGRRDTTVGNARVDIRNDRANGFQVTH